MFANFKEFVLVLIFVKISECFYIVPQGYNKTSQLNKCLAKILKNFPETIRKVSLLTSDGKSDFAIDILHDIPIPVLIDAIEDQDKEGTRLTIYNSIVIIETDNLNVTWILNNVLWNSETKFLVVTDVKKIDFENFWSKNVVNVFVLSEEKEGISLYSFIPYKADACDDIRPILLDKWKGDTFINDGLSEFYDNQRIKDMHQCVVNISVVNLKPTVFFTDNCSHNCSAIKNVDGTEVRLLKIIGEKFNFIGRFSTPADGERFGSIKPPKGLLGEVYTGRSKFGFGSITPIIERFQNLDLSRFYRAKSCVTFVVPVGAGRDRLAWLESIKSDFTLLQWLLIVASLTCVAVVFWIASNFTISRSFLYAFEILLGLSTVIPKKRGLKCLMIFWIIFSILISNMYEASLGSQITVPIKPTEINTLLELVESNLIIMGHRSMYAVSTKIEPIPGLREINKRFIVREINVDNAIKRMAEKKDIAVGGHKSAYMYALINNTKAQGKIRTLKECVYDYFSTIVLHKHSPFTRKTNKILGRVFDSGLFYYWKSIFVRNLPPEVEKFLPMRLKQSFGLIALFLLGLSISFLVFLTELIVGPKKRKNIKKSMRFRKNKFY